MKEPITLMIGVCDEVNQKPMTFNIYVDHGVTFGNDYTHTDLTICRAVLLDLADALEKKLHEMVH